jgi:hypothetical protein
MAKKTVDVVSGFDFLGDPSKFEPRPVCVIVGDDGFLQHEVRRALIARIYNNEADAVPDFIDGETVEKTAGVESVRSQI